MTTRDLIEAKLLEYFYAIEAREELSEEIADIIYQMTGVHGISFDSIKTTSETRDNKLTRMSDKITPLEDRLNMYGELIGRHFSDLHLNELDYMEYLLLEYIYRYKKTYDEIAQRVGYSDKTVVFRKRNKILNKIEAMYKG